MERRILSSVAAFVLVSALVVGCGESGPRDFKRGDVVEGDGRTEWLVGHWGYFTIVIPDGMSLRLGSTTGVPGCRGEDVGCGESLWVFKYRGNSLWVSEWGEEVERGRNAPAANDLFDQLLASMRSVTPGAADLVARPGAAPDERLLEWVPSSKHPLSRPEAVRWEYRLKRYDDYAPEELPKWGPWTDIPGSDVGTRSYLLTGLHTDAAFYIFAVRAVVGRHEGLSAEGAFEMDGPSPE